MGVCHFDGCDSTAQFGTELRMQLGNRALAFKCTIEVCHRHMDKAKDYVLSPPNWQTICAGLVEAGYPDPNKTSASGIVVDCLPLEIDQARVLLPIAKCDREGCANPAAWQVSYKIKGNILRDGVARHVEVKALTNLCVCHGHKKDTRSAQFRKDKAVARYLAQQGVATPDWSSLRIDFIKLEAGQRVDPAAFGGHGQYKPDEQK